MRLRRLMDVADQIVAFRFSSIDLSHAPHERGYLYFSSITDENNINFA